MRHRRQAQQPQPTERPTPHPTRHRGPLNTRNVIPLKYIFSEPQQYGPLVAKLPPGAQCSAGGPAACAEQSWQATRGARRKRLRHAMPLLQLPQPACACSDRLAGCVPLLVRCTGGVYWRSVQDLASLVASDEVASVILDMNGSVGYLKGLLQMYPNLGAKVHVRKAVDGVQSALRHAGLSACSPVHAAHTSAFPPPRGM